MLATCQQHKTMSKSTPSLLSYVDPFIGTAGKGKTYPGATLPYGMVQLSPDNGRNGWDWISGYFYPDNVIAGFSHTHLSGTGAGDLYDISFMPLAGPTKQKVLDQVNPLPVIYSSFSHDNEQATPGYYQVFLTDYQINVELTAGLRTGVQRYTFAKHTQTGQVKLDLNYARNWDKTIATELIIINDHTIAGYRKSTGWAKDQRVYFYSVFSQPFTMHTVSHADNQNTSSNNSDKHYQTSGQQGLSALFDFNLKQQKQVLVKTAISSVSIENAKQNLLTDGLQSSFTDYRQRAEKQWKQALAKVKVTAEHDNMVQFYTALYHSYLAPRVFSDSNGQYKGPDGKIHQATRSPRYSFFSLWDTFRALHPWKTITDTEHSKAMMMSLIAHYHEYGLLPVWNFQGNETNMMMGYHAVPVLVDAYLKRIISEQDINSEQLFNALKKSAMQNDFGIDSYKALGYVPFEHGNWNVSLTLEYAFDDWSIAQMAQALGKIQDAKYFTQRGQNYRQHFDPATGFMRAKSQAGVFKSGFDPLAYHPEDYCEANAWQYNFFVPHDIKGLIQLHGGRNKFANKLDQMFSTKQQLNDKGELPEWISGYIGQYVHGNEPAHHVPYLYQYTGQGHKTQQRVRQIMAELYNTAPNGLAGNEDAGQMSAWYMFSALGFYPVNPVAGEYVLGSPEVAHAQIKLPDNKTFTIIANNQSADNIYVKSVTLNGQPYSAITISHQDIMAGGTLIFNMTSEVH
ncbi:alpha-1 2-mannosidase [Thalassotalea insulae]|uniref:Alpha-1 2-mannosidase n=1 Tax=Thalassotalea insulae TaxID=2056778 RepID=A0ABQ6GP60_9GAMM|nr:alpha-1 2-mannosidase [Thalassotalea insulae]